MTWKSFARKNRARFTRRTAMPRPLRFWRVKISKVTFWHARHGLSHLGRQDCLALNNELKYTPVHGSGGSPVLVDDLLICSCDGGDVQFVVALDKKTGRDPLEDRPRRTDHCQALQLLDAPADFVPTDLTRSSATAPIRSCLTPPKRVSRCGTFSATGQGRLLGRTAARVWHAPGLSVYSGYDSPMCCSRSGLMVAAM